MKKQIKNIKTSLLNIIKEMSEYRWMFCRNPHSDFTRNKKWSFEDVILFMLYTGCESINRELLKYFQFSNQTPSTSSFIQRRHQILPEAFQFIFEQFTENALHPGNYKGLRLLACDGSDINIPHNPDDKTTYFQSTPDSKGFNQIHLNAVYDIVGRFYSDIVIQPARQEYEAQAMCDMIDRYRGPKSVFIADRGYESFNICAHAEENRQYYLIRIKDINSNGIMSGLSRKEALPPIDEFDKHIHLEFTRSQTNKVKQNPKVYRFMPSNVRFDYLPLENKIHTYGMSFRVLRFLISDNNYECIITNLPGRFSTADIRKIYDMRWGIETSFRELKYIEGLADLHAKRMDFILQEIWSKLIIYNFCAAVMIAVRPFCKNETSTYIYQINYTRAVSICKEFLFTKKETSPPDIECLLMKEMLPVRPGRHDTRKLRAQSARSFLYRAA